MNDPQEKERYSAPRDWEIRAALDRHWAASDANDFATEHRIYHEDAVLDYPQSGERTRGRRNIQNQRVSQPSKKRFSVRRILGRGDLWVTEFILTYDGKPSYTVSIMEFRGGKVARETQFSADPFAAPAWRAPWVERMDADSRPAWMEGQEAAWKRLAQFALRGSTDLEQYAILLVRVSLGLFFAISGANKLFVAGGTKPVYETLVTSKVPFPHLMAYFVSAVEFVGGSLLTAGLLSSPASVALLIDMIVATLTTAMSTVPKGLSPLNWLDDFLYLPEVLYVLSFVWLLCSGPGRFSADYLLAGELPR